MHQPPDRDRGSRWQYHRLPALTTTTDPLEPSQRQAQTEARPLSAVDAFLAYDRHHHNLRRMLARAAADHLFNAARLLCQVPSADAVVLSAAGTAEVLYALEDAARTLGGALPADLTALADQLPGWAAALKQQHQAAAAAFTAGDGRRSLVRAPRWRQGRW